MRNKNNTHTYTHSRRLYIYSIPNYFSLFPSEQYNYFNNNKTLTPVVIIFKNHYLLFYTR